jgi:nucleotide-binding universal stress UspA family protein
MKVLATFDGSVSAEAIIDELTKMVTLPVHDVLLFSVVEPPDRGVRMRGPLRPVIAIPPSPGSASLVIQRDPAGFVETKEQAIDRELAERLDYLHTIEARLPAGPRYTCAAVAHDDPARAIIERALAECPDVIVMATHGHSGLVHILFGDVAEEVVRSGVAPVLLVHPESVRRARASTRH